MLFEILFKFYFMLLHLNLFITLLLGSMTICVLAIHNESKIYRYIAKLDHLGSMNGPCYIQNRAVKNCVIKRSRCIY